MDCNFQLQATLGCNFFQLIAAAGATQNCKVTLQFWVAIIAGNSYCLREMILNFAPFSLQQQKLMIENFENLKLECVELSNLKAKSLPKMLLFKFQFSGS